VWKNKNSQKVIFKTRMPLAKYSRRFLKNVSYRFSNFLKYTVFDLRLKKILCIHENSVKYSRGTILVLAAVCF
jgi:hypothetical protein